MIDVSSYLEFCKELFLWLKTFCRWKLWTRYFPGHPMLCQITSVNLPRIIPFWHKRYRHHRLSYLFLWFYHQFRKFLGVHISNQRRSRRFFEFYHGCDYRPRKRWCRFTYFWRLEEHVRPHKVVQKSMTFLWLIWKLTFLIYLFQCRWLHRQRVEYWFTLLVSQSITYPHPHYLDRPAYH